MIKVKQHIPTFCEGFKPERCEVANLEKLLAVPWEIGRAHV